MSFNNDDILTLAKAGFTAEQIAALNSVAQAPEAPAQAPEAPAQAPEAPAQAPEAPAQAPEAPAQAPQAPATAAPHSIDDVLKAISGLTEGIQNANLLAAQMPEKTRETAEDVLAKIINPPSKKED